MLVGRPLKIKEFEFLIRLWPEKHLDRGVLENKVYENCSITKFFWSACIPTVSRLNTEIGPENFPYSVKTRQNTDHKKLCIGIFSRSDSYPEKLGVIPEEIVNNKAKERISKRVLQKNKASQISQKRNVSYPLIRTGTYQSVRKICFSEN